MTLLRSRASKVQGQALCRAWPLLLLAATAALVATGCGPSRSPVFDDQGTELGASENFQSAVDMLDRLTENAQQQQAPQVVYYFNEWLNSQPSEDTWQADPLIGNLPQPFLETTDLARLNEPQLTLADVRYLKEAERFRDISQWSLERPLDEDWDQRLSQWKQESPNRNFSQLREAIGLFDWTIRNVQPVEIPQPPEGSPTGLAGARQAIPSGGYARQPAEAVLLGQGDVLQRARIFMLLLRQRQIDSALLAISKPESSEPQPWAVAVLANGQRYLFDTRLGLPLPTADGQGLLTLNALRDDPGPLRSLDIGSLFRYPIETDDLQHIVALVDASPEALSRRMQLIESRLTGQERMKLTVQPSEVAKRLEAAGGIQETRIWHVPILANVYSTAFERARQQDRRLDTLYKQQTGLYRDSPLAAARRLHLEGQFERDDMQPGALIMYRDLRQPEQRIAHLEDDDQLQAFLGLRRNPYESEEVFQIQVETLKNVLRRSKEHASYWLGVVHYEMENYETAANWFQRRTLEEFEGGQWEEGARYNLARTYEEQQRWEEARDLLLLTESPQRHGNLLRARLIRLRHLEPDQESDTAAEPQESAGGQEKPRSREVSASEESPNEESPNEEAPSEESAGEESASEAPDGKAPHGKQRDGKQPDDGRRDDAASKDRAGVTGEGKKPETANR